jgi:hypothetical protein
LPADPVVEPLLRDDLVLRLVADDDGDGAPDPQDVRPIPPGGLLWPGDLASALWVSKTQELPPVEWTIKAAAGDAMSPAADAAR